jgi:hypothetical protein
MGDYDFVLGATGYDFKKMICVNTRSGSWWHIKYIYESECLCRLGDNGLVPQAQLVTNAYLEDKIDELFLGD